jgi:hypothetical protein
VKVLGHGDLTTQLAVTAHRFSQAARDKIEAAGGSVLVLREPVETPSRKARKRAALRGGPPPGDEGEFEAEETTASDDDSGDSAPEDQPDEVEADEA